ncbi:hypothetical protein RQP46_007756 [Phenoliferia psychrophenolica]
MASEINVAKLPHDQELGSPISTESKEGSIEFEYEDRLPTEEERKTLRLVADRIPLAAVLIAVVEFAERASYYGTSGPFSNFIQRPLPKGGNGAGATPKGTQLTPGALGKGLVMATALTTLFSFLAYTVPILGGVMADTRWGRYRTIVYGTCIAFIAHIIILVAAIPSVIHDGKAIGPFILGLLMLAFGTGFIKSSVAPLMADQATVKVQRIKILPSGERVIVDPAVTVSSIMLLYYWMVNVGAFFKLGTTYAEKRIGFWLAFLVPLLVFLFTPIFLVISYHRLVKNPPQGSVVIDTFKVAKVALEQTGWKGARKGGDDFWNSAKPGVIATTGLKKPKSAGWLHWDDEFVDEIRRTFKACKLFSELWPSIYPAGNFNPIFIIITAPFLNFVLYPTLRKHGIRFGQVARIVAGFGFGTLTMIVGAILQWQVYETSPCGYHATKCAIGTTVSPIAVWAQLPLYAFPAIGELLVSVTAYEVAYTRAPQRMKGLVYALVLFMSALSSALILIVSPSFKDPHLIWPFVGIGVANFVCMFVIWFFFRHLDDVEEDEVLAIGTTLIREAFEESVSLYGAGTREKAASRRLPHAVEVDMPSPLRTFSFVLLLVAICWQWTWSPPPPPPSLPEGTKWADHPIPLVSTPFYLTQSTDAFTIGASEMALLHNVVIRGFNSIYLQAPHIEQNSSKDFISYALTWCRLTIAHRNDEVGHLFEDGLLAMTNYLSIVEANSTAFSSLHLVTLMDSFMEPFAQHFGKDGEITEILDLASVYPDQPTLHPAFSSWVRRHVMKAGVLDGIPFLYANLDRTFENGIWSDWPRIPRPVEWAGISVGGAWNAKVWRYGSCTLLGGKKELEALM